MQAAREGKAGRCRGPLRKPSIAAFRRPRFVRIRLLNSLVDQKKPAEEVLKVVNDILAIDPELPGAVRRGGGVRHERNKDKKNITAQRVSQRCYLRYMPAGLLVERLD